MSQAGSLGGAGAQQLQPDLSENTLSYTDYSSRSLEAVEQKYKDIGEQWDKLDRDEKRDAVELIKKDRMLAEKAQQIQENYDREFREKCAKDGIPVLPDENSFAGSDGIYHDTYNGPGNTTGENKTISTEKPDPKKTKLYHAIIEHADAWKAVADKIYEFPPLEEDDMMLAQAINTATELLDPYSDEKWRKDWLQWFKIQLDNVYHGKHAAAVMNYTISHKGQKRSLTREQVGDKYEETFKMAKKVLENMPVYSAMFKHFTKSQEPRRSHRSIDLSDILSEKS